MTRRHLLTMLVLLFAATAAGLWIGLSRDDAGDGPARAGATASEDGAAAEADGAGSRGSLAIPVDTGRFATLDGDSASLGDLSGRVVVLNLWGTWCPPCRAEIPHLVGLQEEIEPRGGTVVGLAVQSGSPEDIRRFLEDYAVEYPIWRASTRAVVERFQATGFPTTYIVDRRGIIRERFLGPQSEARLLSAAEPYLAEG